jgi:tungstate transport system permease protein
MPMDDLWDAFGRALDLIAGLDPAVGEIVLLSLTVSFSAVTIATLLALPLGALLALVRFPGRSLVVAVLNAFMGLPPVVVGLVVYLALSRSGPLGALGLLFTPTAMIVAQVILVTPIVAAVARQSLADLDGEYRPLLRSLGAGPWRSVPTLLWDARLSLGTAVLAGFGRASGEVGAVMIVGGNIDHVTRTMTTAIALETSKGHLAQALALGFVLVAIALTVALAVEALRLRAARQQGLRPA